MSPNAKFFKSSFRTFLPSSWRSWSQWRLSEPNEAIAPATLSSVSRCQAWLSTRRANSKDHSQDKTDRTIANVQMTRRVRHGHICPTTTFLGALILTLCCISSIGLVVAVRGPNEDQSRQTFSDIITLRQVSRSVEKGSSSAHSMISSNQTVVVPRSHHRVRRLSIWRNPLTTRLRNKLVPLRRSVVVSSRESSFPTAYNRVSHFVRSRLYHLGVSLNDKLAIQKARSLNDSKHQNADNSTFTVTKSAADEISNNQTNTVQADRLIRRNDDSSWVNRIDDADPTMNMSSKSADVHAPYLSPTLNVIDLEPDNTKIAHNILVVRKSGKPATDEHYTVAGSNHDLLLAPKLQTPAPVVVSSEIKNFTPNLDLSTLTTFSPTMPTTSTTKLSTLDDEFVPIKNNHRPSVFMSLAKWKLKNKDKVITRTTAKVESSTQPTTTKTTSPSSSSFSSNSMAPSRVPPPQQQQQFASTQFVVSLPSASPSVATVTSTSNKPITIQTANNQQSSTLISSKQPPLTTAAVFYSPTTQWSSITTTTTTTTTTGAAPASLVSFKLRPTTTTVRTTLGGQSESGADLSTREQWSTVGSLSQDDSWSSYATENPMTTVFTTGSVTEFDLPVTRPSLDANESTQSWEMMHNGDGAQPTSGGKDAAWSESITRRPLDANSTNDRSATTNTSAAQTGTLDDDNSIVELLKEYQHKQTNRPTITTTTSTTTQMPIEDKGADRVNFYHDHTQHQPKPQHNASPVDDGVVIFKNNHGRPRPRPMATSRPPITTTNKFIITAKPPYVTDFIYPTTISVKKPGAITVANIVAHRVKQPDEVQSASLTVLDPPFVPNTFMQLPLNTTIVHKNILVPMKEGRPRPSYPTRPTPHFPVDPVVAGVSNWQSQTTPWVLPTMTTSSPEILSASNNFTSEEDFKQFTTTPAPKPTKTIIKIISVRPVSSASSNSYDHALSHGSASISTITSTAAPLSSTTSSTTPRPPSYPVTSSSGGYVNAIYAPPMPVLRPSHSAESTGEPPRWINGWVKPLRRLVNAVAPSQGSVSFMSLVRSVLYSLMVMLLPPLALMSAFSLV